MFGMWNLLCCMHDTYVIIVGLIISENRFRIDRLVRHTIIVHFHLVNFHQLPEKIWLHFVYKPRLVQLVFVLQYIRTPR